MKISRGAGFLLFLVVVGTFAFPFYFLSRGFPLTAWLVGLLCLLLFTLGMGRAVTTRWAGAIIDNRNVMSLSRLQMVIWTVLVLSAFLTGAIWNIQMDFDEPLTIGIPTQLWILMGISTTSLIGSPLLLNEKKDKEPKEPPTTAVEEQRAGDQQDAAGEPTTAREGTIATNRRIEDAAFSDMFTGDEVSNWRHLDVAKLQMFFFTLVIALAYAVALGRLFWTAQNGGFNALPALDESILALIGISHAGYLGGKSINHTQIEKAPPGR